MPVLPFDAYVTDLIHAYGYGTFEHRDADGESADQSAVRFFIMYTIWQRGIKNDFLVGRRNVITLVEIVQRSHNVFKQKLLFLNKILKPRTARAHTKTGSYGLLSLCLLAALTTAASATGMQYTSTMPANGGLHRAAKGLAITNCDSYPSFSYLPADTSDRKDYPLLKFDHQSVMATRVHRRLDAISFAIDKQFGNSKFFDETKRHLKFMNLMEGKHELQSYEEAMAYDKWGTVLDLETMRDRIDRELLTFATTMFESNVEQTVNVALLQAMYSDGDDKQGMEHIVPFIYDCVVDQLRERPMDNDELWKAGVHLLLLGSILGRDEFSTDLQPAEQARIFLQDNRNLTISNNTVQSYIDEVLVEWGDENQQTLLRDLWRSHYGVESPGIFFEGLRFPDEPTAEPNNNERNFWRTLVFIGLVQCFMDFHRRDQESTLASRRLPTLVGQEGTRSIRRQPFVDHSLLAPPASRRLLTPVVQEGTKSIRRQPFVDHSLLAPPFIQESTPASRRLLTPVVQESTPSIRRSVDSDIINPRTAQRSTPSNRRSNVFQQRTPRQQSRVQRAVDPLSETTTLHSD